MDPLRFINRLGDVLDFEQAERGDGLLLSWQDDVQQGIAEHLVLQRTGALHEVTHTPPRRFSFRCILAGPGVKDRYARLVAALRSAPEGTLSHPRFGSMPAVWLKISASENPGEQAELIEYSIDFAESGLAEVQRQSAGAAGQLAVAQASTLQTVSASSPAPVQAKVLQIVQQVAAYKDLAARAESAGATSEEVDLALQATLLRIAELGALRGVTYAVVAQAALVADAARQAQLALYANRPPVIEYVLPGAMTLPRLCALLYGGRHARAMQTEIRRLSLLPDVLIPAGTRLPIPDPQVVKRNG